MAATLNRYALPVPEGADGESVHLCNDCLDLHPQSEELEHLESSRPSLGDECEGPGNDQECPNAEDEEDEDEPEDD